MDRIRQPQLSSSTKLRIIEEYNRQGYKPTAIWKLLIFCGYKLHRSTVFRFLNRWIELHSISRAPGSGRPNIIDQQILSIVRDQMSENDETTAFQLRKILLNRGLNISLRTIFLRVKSSVGFLLVGILSAHSPCKYTQKVGLDRQRDKN